MRVHIEEFYICDICGEVYDNKNDCRRCEQSHLAPISVVPSSAKYIDNSYPRSLQVMMNDGNVAEYHFHSIVSSPTINNKE